MVNNERETMFSEWTSLKLSVSCFAWFQFSLIISSFYTYIFQALKLSFESDDEQLSWLKQFERSGVKTGETEEVLIFNFFNVLTVILLHFLLNVFLLSIAEWLDFCTLSWLSPLIPFSNSFSLYLLIVIQSSTVCRSSAEASSAKDTIHLPTRTYVNHPIVFLSVS